MKPSDVTQAMRLALANNSKTADYVVEIGEAPNTDPDVVANNAWVGLYRVRGDYTIKGMAGNSAASWQINAVFVILVQASSMEDAKTCEDLLDGRVENVLNVIFTDLGIRQTLDTVNDITVDFTDARTEEAAVYYQEAVIEFNGIVGA